MINDPIDLLNFDSVALKKLGKVMFQGRKLLVDAFVELELCYEFKGLSIRGFWKVGNRRGEIGRTDILILKDSTWIVLGAVLRRCRAPRGYVERLLEASFQITEEEKRKLIDSSEIELFGDLEVATVQNFPILQLTDRTGAFAKLFIDYGSLGKVDFTEARRISWRRVPDEKGWERDLLETDFVKKIVDNADYYCPMNKVGKSLTFLLEIGWKIVDYKGRQVMRETEKSLSIARCDEGVEVKGAVVYGEHVTELKSVMGAFNRKDRFVSLSEHTVGLLDQERIAAEWADLTDLEFVGTKAIVPKKDHGLLTDLFPEVVTLFSHAPLHEETRFTATLYPHQEKGVEWLHFLKQGGFHGLLADEMGLGKTVQLLGFIATSRASLPILVVMPTSLLFNWRKECERFVPDLKVLVHSGSERTDSVEDLSSARIILTSYAVLRQDAALFAKVQYEMVILDEAQLIKNSESQLSSVVCRLSANFRLAMTGTPIENRSEDLFSLFSFIMPELLGDKSDFKASITAGAQDVRYLNQIRKKLRPYILRRRKDEVGVELPTKDEQLLFVEMNEEQQSFYDAFLQKSRSGLVKKIAEGGAASHRMEILEAILRLRQICGDPMLLGSTAPSAKMERLLSDIEGIFQEKRKVLVYSQFTQILQKIGQELTGRQIPYLYLDGSSLDREESVRLFQENLAPQVFLLSLKAGGVGLNLTSADYVLLYDPWWNEAVEQQAIDRAHRLGRTGSVIARRYVTALSIEEKMMRLKESKSKLASDLLDFDGDSLVSLETMLELLK